MDGKTPTVRRVLPHLSRVLPPLCALGVAAGTIAVIPSQISTRVTAAVNARFFPFVIAVAIAVFSALDLVIQVVAKPAPRIPPGSSENTANLSGVILTVICLGLWVILTPQIGFVASSVALVAVTMMIAGNRRPTQLLLFPASVVAILYVAFVIVLRIRFL